jgi:hypothetical protein
VTLFLAPTWSSVSDPESDCCGLRSLGLFAADLESLLNQSRLGSTTLVYPNSKMVCSIH